MGFKDDRKFDEFWKKFVESNKMNFSTGVLEMAFREIAKSGFDAGYDEGFNTAIKRSWSEM